MAARKKNTSSVLWDKIFFISGEPFMARQNIDAIVSDHSESADWFTSESKIGTVIASLTMPSLSDPPPAVVVTSPTADTLKRIYEVLSERQLTPSCLIITSIGDAFDARTSFVQAASKAKRVYDFPYMEVGDTTRLRQHLKEWEVAAEVKMHSDALNYLLTHAPTCTAKIKSSGTKRETQVVDLEALESELDKVMAVRKHEGGLVTKQDLEEICGFDQVQDVWAFVDVSVSGDARAILNKLDMMSFQQDAISSLWLLASQLEFLIGVSSLVARGITDADAIASNLSISNLLGAYLGDDWAEVEPREAPVINVWRVRKALERKSVWKNRNIVNQYTAVINAIQDLRTGTPNNIVFPMLALALSGAAPYNIPLSA